MQLSYDLEMTPCVAGSLADLSVKVTDSFAAEEAMNAGVPVVLGTVPAKQVKVVASADDCAKVVGVTQFVHKEQVVNGKYYPLGWAVPVVTTGRVWVKVDGDVVAGEHAKYDFDNEIWSATNGTEVPNVAFRTATVKGFAQVEIR